MIYCTEVGINVTSVDSNITEVTEKMHRSADTNQKSSKFKLKSLSSLFDFT